MLWMPLQTDWIVWSIAALALWVMLKLQRMDITWKPMHEVMLVSLCLTLGVACLDSLHTVGLNRSSWLETMWYAWTAHEQGYGAPFSLYGLDGQHLNIAEHVWHWGYGLVMLAWALGIVFMARVCTDSQGVLWSICWVIALGMLFFLAHFVHVLGTDKIGQDVFLLCLKSLRTAWVIGGLTLCVMLPLSLVLGLFAGYFGGWVDDVVQFVYTTLSAIPGILLISAAILAQQFWLTKYPHLWLHKGQWQLIGLCLILGVTGWPSLCRMIRGEALKIKQMDFVTNAKLIGSHPFRIMIHHLCPHMWHIMMITAILDFSGLVLAEAVLTYVGVGVDPTMASFGNLIFTARYELIRVPVVWWTIAGAFIFMLFMVLPINLLADKVRMHLLPEEKAGHGRDL